MRRDGPARPDNRMVGMASAPPLDRYPPAAAGGVLSLSGATSARPTGGRSRDAPAVAMAGGRNS